MKNYFYILMFSLGWVSVVAQFQTQELIIDQKIHGTLFQSDKESNQLAIIIPGSGPTDRNGNQHQLENNSLRFLAEGLASHKINAFTFDKAFFHDKTFDSSKMVFENMVEDVSLLVHYFQSENPKTKIILVGHSEGSLVGILVAQKQKVDYLVSLAGTGVSIDETITSQIEKQAPFLVNDTKAVFAELKNGQIVEDFYPMLASVFNKESQPFLISWMKYNPQLEIKKVNTRTLLVQGTKDLQVRVEDANLLKSAKPNAKLVILENMNHVLKEIKGDDTENMTSYNQPDLPLHPQLVSSIVEFVKP
jgi:pimeloyl-ACP methyl ester carboxylesterase